jgi:hypothetical protein
MIFNSISSKHLMTKDATVFFRASIFLILNGFFSIISHAQISVDYVVVGGGGGAGTASSSQKGGGGGSGGLVVSGSATFSTLVYNITLGGGGASPDWGTTNNGTNGNPSSISANGFTTIIAAGGSKGSNASGATSGIGGSNGSLYGNGGNGLTGTTPNNGANGKLIVLLDTETYFGGGGGGGNWSGSPGGYGNSGLGSIGAGARGQNARSGGVGGAGIATAGTVVIRYESSSALATGGTITSYIGNGTNGTNGVVYQVHKFTADGTFEFNGGGSLPVTMSYFKLNCVEEDVELIWQTSSEHNSDYFQLESSLDGVNWEIEQTLPASGFSQELINYYAVDQDASRNQKYYRLKQVDFNGAFEIYGPLKTDCAVESTNIGLHPNPCETEVTISIASKKPTDLNYTLISPEGKLLETKQIAVLAGITVYTLDVSNFPSGMYMLQFDVNDKHFIKKLTVQ